MKGYNSGLKSVTFNLFLCGYRRNHQFHFPTELHKQHRPNARTEIKWLWDRQGKTYFNYEVFTPKLDNST